MPRTRLVYYKEEDGSVPVIDWLDTIPGKAVDKCIVKIERLEEKGHELRRPEADFLRDGIYELRTRYQNVQYRILYFFHGNKAVVLSHGITKQRAEVGDKEIQAAINRKAAFESAPARHTFTGE